MINIFFENELEPIPQNESDASSERVANLKLASCKWGGFEIIRARKICLDLSYKILSHGGSVNWCFVDISKSALMCNVIFNPYDEKSGTGFAKPYKDDNFNIWIGKCVSLCKAVGVPVPDFIKNKNKE